MGRYDRAEKNAIRRATFEALAPNTFGSVLTLPGPDALCVRDMLAEGLIDRSTRQVWIENHAANAVRLPQLAERMRLPNVKVVQTSLEDYHPNRTFDLVNADMETGFTARLGAWIETVLSPMLDNGAVVVTSTLKWSRNNPFAEWMVKHRTSDKVLGRLFEQVSCEIGNGHPRIVLPHVMLRLALHRHVLQQGPSADYTDSNDANRMVVVGVRVAGKAESPLPCLSHYLNLFDPQRTQQDRSGDGLLARLRSKLETLNLHLVQDHERTWLVKHSPDARVPISSDRSIATLAARWGVE